MTRRISCGTPSTESYLTFYKNASRRAATTPIDMKFGAKVHNYFFFRTNALISPLIAHQCVDARRKKKVKYVAEQ